MYEDFIKKTIDEFIRNEQIRLMDIPDIDLYIDQVTKFMDEKLNHRKRSENDKILTKTMINNYTKNNVLPKPEKKKYSKEHLIFLIYIYYLKQVLAIKDIDKLLKPLIDSYRSNIDITDLYTVFVDLQEEEYKKINIEIKDQIENVKEKLKEVDLSDNDNIELLTLTLTLIAKANAEKYIAEKIIDEYFLPKKEEKKSVKKMAKKEKKNNADN